ncbi:MAG: AgmX/PglI C-terminal domain-containing protein [Deltaproteobacteria bacterium]|jgi:outer membrane biosynthesis protein TonB|nr:AgmX/PglI C-terminal domain-containing protein [Deltaproteobacteria bacterium]
MTEHNSSHQAESIRTELRAARERLDRLVADLRAVDAELDALETERQRFELVREACVALESLEEMGASALFWEGSQLSDAGERHLRVVRSRLDGFDKQIGEIEERRQELLDEVGIRQEEADFIAGDLLEADRLAEQKKNEWEIERELDWIPIRTSVMPWAQGGEDDRRLRKALAIALLVSFAFGLLLPLVDLPLPERWEVLEEQERLTQLIREARPEPPVAIREPTPVVPDEKTEPQEQVEEQQLAEESAPSPEPAPAAEKAKVASQGILAFREQLSGISQNDAVARLGSNARLQDGGDAAAGLPERSMVTTQAPGSSGGINVAALSRSTGGSGQGLGGVAVAQATSTIGGGGGSDRPLAGGGPGLSRTDEEIQIVFDRHKAALYRFYNRALRSNPTLKGQIVLRLTIEPDGSVSFCAVKSSDMNAQELSRRVVERVETFDFGAKGGIPAITIVYPIDFLPAT